MRDSTNTPMEVINEITPSFEAFKETIKDYPNAFRMVWDEKEGYGLTVDLDFLELDRETKDLNP